MLTRAMKYGLSATCVCVCVSVCVGVCGRFGSFNSLPCCMFASSGQAGYRLQQNPTMVKAQSNALVIYSASTILIHNP